MTWIVVSLKDLRDNGARHLTGKHLCPLVLSLGGESTESLAKSDIGRATV